VQALAEGQVAFGVGPVQVEPVRLSEGGPVAAGGGEPQVQAGALGEVDAAQRDRAGGDPAPDGHRRVVAESFLDRPGDQVGLLDDLVPAGRVLQQAADRVADQPGGGLVAGERQREQDRGALVQGEAVRGFVVDGDQVTGQVVPGRGDLEVDRLRM